MQKLRLELEGDAAAGARDYRRSPSQEYAKSGPYDAYDKEGEEEREKDQVRELRHIFVLEQSNIIAKHTVSVGSDRASCDIRADHIDHCHVRFAYVSRKAATQPWCRRCCVTNLPLWLKYASQVEQVLETYFMNLDNTYNKLQTLGEYVDDTEDYVRFEIDTQRNRFIEVSGS